MDKIKHMLGGVLVVISLIGTVCALGFVCKLITIIFKLGWSLV